jgi:hypothetical protein
VSHASAQIQWGDVGTWVGGIATALALFLTYVLLRITRREQTAQQDEQRRAQARLISAWPAGAKHDGDGPRDSVTIVLQNESNEPIYSLRAAVGRAWTGEKIGYREARLDYIMPPKSKQEQPVPVDWPRLPDGAQISPPVELIFSDAAGKFWHRDRYGALTEIREVPLSAEKHFFQSRRDE